jgi:geranylgeranyl pyrophosphate synthase
VTVRLDDYLRARIAEVDAALARWLPGPPACPERLAVAMRYSVEAGGKRIRPLLVLASAEATAQRTGASEADARALALPAACAIEMIHTYSLVHDDLPAMDDDTLRRGRPTLHVAHGEGMAILAGDALQAAAFHLLAAEPPTRDDTIARRKLHAIEIVAIAAGARGMVGGQAIDLEAVRPGPGREALPLDREALREMHARKTGALLRASCLAGGVMAGADDSLLDALAGYGDEIGLAFQIVDDLLDVEGDSSGIGKTPGKDAAAGKPTYPALYGIEQSRALAAACIERAEGHLARAGLAGSPLAPLARRVLERRS